MFTGRLSLVFFTNIAHEFRTPLTLMQGSLEKEKRIMKVNRWQTELEKTIRVMDKSVQRMLRLIDQLLEFRKMQAGKNSLKTEAGSFGVCHFINHNDKCRRKRNASHAHDYKLFVIGACHKYHEEYNTQNDNRRA